MYVYRSKTPMNMKLNPNIMKMFPVFLKNLGLNYAAYSLFGNDSHSPVIANLNINPPD